MSDQVATGAIIYRSADRLFRRHGRDAMVVAEIRAAWFLGQGDMNAYRMWKRIILVMDTMFSTAPPEGTPLH